MSMHFPDWTEVEEQIPAKFKFRHEITPPYPPGSHNGASSPFRSFYSLLYSDETLRLIERASRIHDFGYNPVRLLGAPFKYITRKQWDLMYRQIYLDNGKYFVAIVHYRAVRLGGQSAWNRNREIMTKKYGTYQNWLEV